MIFVDSNIPMYLVGAPHPRKLDSQLILERFIAAGERLVTDAEVIQEILRRYFAIGRREAIDLTLQVVLDIADEVIPVEKLDVLRAGEIVQSGRSMTARAAIHVAIMERHGIRSILSFDADFDRWPGIERISQL